MAKINVEIEKVGKGYILSWDITAPMWFPCDQRDLFLNEDELMGRLTETVRMFFEVFKPEEKEH